MYKIIMYIPGGYFRSMGLHFHDWTDYNRVTFSIELLEWGRTFSYFGGKTALPISQLANVPECLYCC